MNVCPQGLPGGPLGQGTLPSCSRSERTSTGRRRHYPGGWEPGLHRARQRCHSGKSQGINISCCWSCLCFYANCSGCQMGKGWQRHPSPGCSLLSNLAGCQSPAGWPQLWPVLSLDRHSRTQCRPEHCGGSGMGGIEEARG